MEQLLISPMASRHRSPTAQEASAPYQVTPEGVLTYVDTSVWVALLAREAPAAALTPWLANAPALCCADWTQLELTSALGIKHRRGELPLIAARAICDVFASMMAYQVREIPLSPTDVSQARALCFEMGRGLRAGDALHLAVATRLKCTHFFSFDHNLNRHAELAGLRLTTL